MSVFTKDTDPQRSKKGFKTYKKTKKTKTNNQLMKLSLPLIFGLTEILKKNKIMKVDLTKRMVPL